MVTNKPRAWKAPFSNYGKTIEKRWYRKENAERALAETKNKKLSPKESKGLKEKYKMNYKPGNRSDITDALRVDPVERVTFFGRNKEAMNAAGKLAEKISKKEKRLIVINDVGYGERGNKKSESFEPFEIANQMSKKGVDFRLSGYTSTQKAAELTKKSNRISLTDLDLSLFNKEYLESFSKTFGKPKWGKKEITLKIPKQVREKMRFGTLDIVDSTPAKRADITFCMNVGLNLLAEEKKIALFHLANSTVKNGYIVTDILFPEKTLKKIGIKKEYIESKKYIVYKKVR